MHDDEYASLISDTSNRPEITANQKKEDTLAGKIPAFSVK
jgi:hypothetical protein